jgi:hypothetical protein
VFAAYGGVLNTLNSATQYNNMLPPSTALCCHLVRENPAMGNPKELAASSTPKACGNIYQQVTDGSPVIAPRSQRNSRNGILRYWAIWTKPLARQVRKRYDVEH